MDIETLAGSLESLAAIAATVPEPETAVGVDVRYANPESYLPRVFIFVHDGEKFYELLKTGEASGPWTVEQMPLNSNGFWIADVDRLQDFGMYRAS